MKTSVPAPAMSAPPECKPPAPAVRLPYEPPKAAFVPLQIEERLMACSKFGSCAINLS